MALITREELSSVSVFGRILKTEAMASFMGFLDKDLPLFKRTSFYSTFVDSLSSDNYCFSDFLLREIFCDENTYIVRAAKGENIPDTLLSNVKAELEIFSCLTRITHKDICDALPYEGYIPEFENRAENLADKYFERVANISKYGYGVFAGAGMFTVSGEEIIPIKSADSIDVSHFVGYEKERKLIFDNTEALLLGKPSANVLLFGDAGTGKSSTVKACANHFADRGLRLIELRKDQLFEITYIMGRIADNPLKFIIFIDDLSFNKNDDCFSMLKAALEGSACAKAKNAVIYATSNRRHIVKETFADRGTSSDIHHNDTVQELMSLSDRFGLTVYFEKPNKKLYIDIVCELARRAGITTDKEELERLAEAFALKKGSRSPRAAEQFIESLL